MSMTVEVVEIAGVRLPCCGTVLERRGWVTLLAFRGSSFTCTIKGGNVLCHNCGKTRGLPWVYSGAGAARRAGDAVACLDGHRRDDFLFTWHKEDFLLPEPAAAS